MSKAHPGKLFAIAIILFIAAVGGAGYYSFSNKGAETPVNENSPLEQSAADGSGAATEIVASEIIAPQPDDIVYGNADAPVTIIDYSSLSCPHCAHFHNEILPDLQKQFIDSGKVKLVFRHFPLNEPALRAAQLVNCAAPAQKQAFLKVVFDKQGDWGFTEDFLKELKQLAALGGISNAAFDACIADKTGENRIVEVRKVAAAAGKVTSTPSFFVNGVPLNGGPTVSNFSEAIAKASAK